MIITWSSGSLNLEDAWIEDKAEVEVDSERTITGEVVVYLPAVKRYTIKVNACTFEDAMLIKELAKTGTEVQIDDEGFLVRGKIVKVNLRHFVGDVKEPSVRQRINLYVGTFELEALP